jgi:hypothetical protein
MRWMMWRTRIRTRNAGEEDRRQQTACLGTVEGSRSKEEGDGDRGVSGAPA